MFIGIFTLFAAGIATGLAFTPTYFIPGVLGLSYLLKNIDLSYDKTEAFKQGYIFGFGFFLASLYWISVGVSVYIEQFWWAIPFALFGLPLIMAFFPAFTSAFVFRYRNSNYFHLMFCCVWVFSEWVSSWIFTGLPWCVLGYSLSFSVELIQAASVISVFGLSFCVIYIASMFYTKHDLITRILISILIVLSMISYGFKRVEANPTQLTGIKVRIVQPSIPQTEKWDPSVIWQNIDRHIELSTLPGDPHIIIWSEAALVIPHTIAPLRDLLIAMLKEKDQILITGGISNNGKQEDEFELYSALLGINKSGYLEFEYHKSHLVPFGEYMPLKDILPMKKITPGIIDYTQGNPEIVTLKKYNLKIKPQICYESIFPGEVLVSNQEADVIINITNDAWYGKTSGPYQHLNIARMRALESGLPLIRAANNGISAIVDPVGRMLQELPLNKFSVIDGYLPKKLVTQTSFSKYRYIPLVLLVSIVLLLQILVWKMKKILS